MPTARKPRPPKDDQAPKKPLTSFFLYSNERRPEIKAKEPDMKPHEMTRQMGAEWKSMEENKKATYTDTAAASKKKYNRKMEKYKLTADYEEHQQRVKAWKKKQQEEKEDESGESEASTSPPPKKTLKTFASSPHDSRRKNPPKDPDAPRKPLTSFFLFAKSIRAQTLEDDPDLVGKSTKISKVLGAKWKALTDNEKEPFSVEAKRLKALYNGDLAQYQKTESYSAYQEKKKAWLMMKDAQMPKVRLPRKPRDDKCPKRPNTSYFLFANEVRARLKQENPDKKLTEIAKLMGQQWKEVGEDQKADYDRRAKQLKEQYNVDLARYRGSEDEKRFEVKLSEWKAECEERKTKAMQAVIRKNEREKAKGKKTRSHKASPTKTKGKTTKGKAKTKGKSKRSHKKKKKMDVDESEESSSYSDSSGDSDSSTSSGSGSTDSETDSSSDGSSSSS